MTNTYYVLSALGGLGCLIAGLVALWSAVWGPRARKRQEHRAAEAAQRAAEAEDRAYRRETHQALYGIPERRDDSGALIAHAKPGLIASMEAVQGDVRTLKAEFPVNGVPARTAIDMTNQNVADLRRELKEHTGDREAHLR